MDILYETYVGADDYSLSLKHHGIKGQKWGVRRFQNPDGSYTDAGRKRRGLTGESRERRGLSDKQKKALKKTAAIAAVAATAYAAYKFGKSPSSSDSINNSLSTIRKMSDDELLTRIGRLEKEKQLYNLEREVSRLGESKSKDILEKAGKQAAATMASASAVYVGKKALKNVVDAFDGDGDKVLREMFPKKK